MINMGVIFVYKSFSTEISPLEWKWNNDWKVLLFCQIYDSIVCKTA